MSIQGRVHNGVVVLPEGISLPEGTEVTVSCPLPNGHASRQQKRVEFPLVRSESPGSVTLTAERIAEILEEEDVSP